MSFLRARPLLSWGRLAPVVWVSLVGVGCAAESAGPATPEAGERAEAAGRAGTRRTAWSGNEYGVVRAAAKDVVFPPSRRRGDEAHRRRELAATALWSAPRVASGPGEYLVVWADRSHQPGAVHWDSVWARRVSEAGAPLGPAVLVAQVPNPAAQRLRPYVAVA